MLKIRCLACTREFMWTDEMPPRGKCPNPECDGRYDVHEALRQNLAARDPAAGKICTCPACGHAISARWTLCEGCGRIVAGSRTFTRRQLLFATAVALLVVSLALRLWIRF